MNSFNVYIFIKFNIIYIYIYIYLYIYIYSIALDVSLKGTKVEIFHSLSKYRRTIFGTKSIFHIYVRYSNTSLSLLLNVQNKNRDFLNTLTEPFGCWLQTPLHSREIRSQENKFNAHIKLYVLLD